MRCNTYFFLNTLTSDEFVHHVQALLGHGAAWTLKRVRTGLET
jgi:hypothetical protein